MKTSGFFIGLGLYLISLALVIYAVKRSFCNRKRH